MVNEKHIVLICLFAAALCAAVEPLVIYDDATAWTISGTGNVLQTNVVHNGTSAIYVPSSLILKNTNTVSCSGYDRIEFWAHGGAWGTGAKRYDIFLESISATYNRQQRYLWIASGKWEKYSVPLTYLGSPTHISRLSITFDGSPGAIYVDDIRLVSGEQDSYMPIPTNYPEMILDGGFEDGANGQYCMGSKCEAVTNPVHSGNYALRVYDHDPTRTYATGPNFEITRYMMIGGTGTYEVSMWYRAAQGVVTAAPAMEILYYDQTDNNNGRETLPGQTNTAVVGTNEWTQIKYRVKTKFGQLLTVCKLNPVVEKVDGVYPEYYLDDVSIIKIPEDGDPANPVYSIDRFITQMPATGPVVDNATAGFVVSIIGSAGAGPGQFKYPAGLFFDPQDNLWVADTDNHRIQKRSPSRVWTNIGSYGTNEWQFRYPRAVSLDSSGRVYVADSGNLRMIRIDGTNWTELYRSAATGYSAWVVSPGTMEEVAPLKYDTFCFSSNDLLLLDMWYGMLCKSVSSTNWEVINSYEITTKGVIQPSGISSGRFDLPMGVCADPSGNVYVADTGNHRIQKRTAGGTNWTVLAGIAPDSRKCIAPQYLGSGSGSGNFNLPQAVAADSNGNVYVADTGNHRIQIFDTPTGQWIALGQQGTAIGEFDAPGGIAVNSNGDVYVADTRNHRIVVFANLRSDSDGDGMSNWAEYVAGANPTNPASVFSLSGLRSLPSGNTLRWNAASGRVYSVYWTSNLLSGFQPFATNVPWTGNIFTDAVHWAENQGFYRVDVRLQSGD